jgi:DNA primase
MGVRDNVELVRNALNPLDIIREAVPSLRQSGNRWRGLCPFHNERTPSFFFHPDKGMWHCFGSCQEGGDVFKFVMRLERLTFPEALRQLAQRAGVHVQWERDEASSPSSSEREKILGLLDQAARYYHETLLKSAEAEAARRYLAKRKLKPETVERFRLGYAPSAGGFFEDAIKRNVPVDLLTKAGLATRSDRTGRLHDPMRQRLTFPILDPYGRVVAFGGRVLEADQQPKYLNSPETPVYTKGRQLYGLFTGRTALRDKGQAVLVEGYMDVVGCHQAGIETAVAPLGTALTPEQASLLKRYVRETVLLYDPDAAGVQASWRSSDVLIRSDLYLRVASLPDGLDPDEFVQRNGTQALQDRLDAAEDIVEFWLNHIAPAARVRGSLADRIALAKEILAFVSRAPNEMLRDEWLRKLSQRLSLDAGSLRRELQKPSAPVPAARKSQAAPAPRRPAMRSVEEEILQLLCNHPEAVVPVPDVAFADARCARVWQAVRSRNGEVAGLVNELSPEDGNWFSSLLLEEKKFENPAEALRSRLAALNRRRDEGERRSLEKDVLRMLEGKIPRDEAVIARYQALTRVLKTGGAPVEAKATN